MRTKAKRKQSEEERKKELGKQETKWSNQAIIKSINQKRMIANKKVGKKPRQKNAKNETKTKARVQESKKDESKEKVKKQKNKRGK